MSKTKKLLALVLSVLTFFGVFSCSTTVFAEEYNSYVADREYQDKLLTEAVENEKQKAEIVCEVPEKRDEFSKTYKRADGSFTTVFSKTPLHTYDGSEWKEIDNSLQSNGDVIENADGKFDVEFPESLSSDDKITIENQGENISFSLNNIDESTAQVAPDTEAADVVENDLGKPVSEITYENIGENTDVQYIVSSNYVKENIIVSNKSSLKDTYSFTIEKGDLTATLGDDNSLTFKNAQGETAFTIPAPVMTDDNKAVSYDIGVSVANESISTLTLTYTPSKEWLESSDRAYPVTLDPVVEMPSDDESIIEDVMISYDYSDPDTRHMNTYNQSESHVVNTDNLHTDILVNINMNIFAGLKNPEIEITDANYYVNGKVEGGNVLVKEINGTWDATAITYDDVHPADGSASQITYGIDTIDFASGGESTEFSLIYFNITDIFKEALANNTNADFAIVAEDSTVRGEFELGTTSTEWHYDSYLSVDYVDTSCGNDSFEYLTQEIGRAGTAYVNTFSRSLTMTRSDISMDGLRMPVNVGFAYNPAFRNFGDIYLTATGMDLFYPYGNGWLPLNLQALFSINENQWQAFTGEGTLVTFNQATETVGDGEDAVTKIVFEPDSTSDSGYSLELIDETKEPSNTNLRLISPDGYATYFHSGGVATAICDSEDELTPNTEAIRYSYPPKGIEINKITDGTGRQYVFTYNETTKLLEKINCLTADGTQIKAGTTDKDLCVTYSYDGNKNLTGVTYPDGKTITYTYDDGLLTNVKNIDDYNILYTYDNQGKVTEIAEFADINEEGKPDINGNLITLTPLSNRQVKITDSYTGTQIQQFGRDGKLNYTFDDKGNYSKSDYAPANDENVYSSSEWSVVPENLLKNGSFEYTSALNNSRGKYWSANFEKAEIEDAFDGNCAYLISSESNVTKYVEQSVDVLNPCSYTLSAYVKSQVDGSLTLKIIAKNSSNTTEIKTEAINATDGWEQFSVTYTPSPNFVPTSITACIGFENNKGTYYVDGVQLESGNGTAEYNLIENGSFNNSDEYWTESTIVDESINGEAVKAVKFTGGLPSYANSVLTDNVSSITQSIAIDGKKGDVYSIGGWFKGEFDDNHISDDVSINASQAVNSLAQIKVTYSYTDTVTTTDETTGEETQTEQTITENFAVDFSAHNNGWQYAVDSFALKADVTNVDVTVLAKNLLADSFATNIELTKDNDAISFDFDEADTEGETTTESEGNTEPAPACPCTDCEEIDCSCRCTTAEECTCVQCKRRGNIEEKSEDGTSVTTKSYDGNKYMQSTVHYSDDLNYITSEIDTNNISSGYAYTDSGLQISSSDGSGVVTTYQSNPMGYLTLAQTNATGLTDNAVKAAISYVYNGDTLTEVNEGNVQYKYSYDKWGQLNYISVDENIIVSYNYGDEESRSQLKNIVFGDTEGEDFTIEYSYTNGNITSVDKYILVEGERDSVIYNYEYDNLGNLTEIRDNATGHRISYTDTGLVIDDIETNQIIYEIADVTPEVEETDVTEEAEENTNEPVSITQETANGVSYNHNIYESAYDSITGKTTETEAVVGGKTIGTQTVSDWFGRNESAVVMTKNPVDTAVTDFASITSNYEYKTTGNTTTNLVSAINNTITGSGTNSVNYAYTYDNNGRITGISTVSSVQNLSGNVSYTYDELGQLVSETNGNTTYQYAYDSKGNISSRKAYSGETLVDTDTFTYGATAWKDRLTGYNNGTITYDTIGNPTSYLGATLTWRGRELSKYVEGNKQISYSYDVDGMRYQKIVKTSGVETARYDYVYSDGKLILLTHTANGVANTARFIYDSFGEPRGFILNNSSAYLYLKNGQGDITAIVDENGEILVRYTYNAWGAVEFIVPFGIDPAVTTVLATVSPFTYRGYCYDFDLGLYYLQSRYYDPQICRFINADSTDYLGATGTLLSYNLFAYCENDPVDYVDPSGTTLAEYLYKNYKGYGYVKKQNKNSVLMKSSNSEILISVVNNSILISAYMYIYGDLSTIRFATKSTYKNEFVKGIEKIWSGTFSEVFDEKVTLKTKIYLCKSYAVKVNMLNKYGKSQRTSNMSNWKLSNLGSLKIYKGGTNKKNYSLSLFYNVAAHEFGHLLGGLEVYGDKYSVLANNQNYFRLVARDIERVLKAFARSKYQGW